ncbi:hypothetical protein BIY29_17265 [Brenneria alni]|uniref:PucR C-terminal helix-turn-helix domain-containing protein n=1 Tax=Brenneria alni TaxID=71656 RepID=A0A421DJS4_9GAMM|nr:helix-turn-helix domain-containing protein [Brenneria alni]RLM19061.1 hypothetical protein BIY29_17265 [Brenneria alni]
MPYGESKILGHLFDGHRKKPALLLETLDAVLQENSNFIKAAERLAIRRNTLNCVYSGLNGS